MFKATAGQAGSSETSLSLQANKQHRRIKANIQFVGWSKWNTATDVIKINKNTSILPKQSLSETNRKRWYFRDLLWWCYMSTSGVSIKLTNQTAESMNDIDVNQSKHDFIGTRILFVVASNFNHFDFLVFIFVCLTNRKIMC